MERSVDAFLNICVTSSHMTVWAISTRSDLKEIASTRLQTHALHRCTPSIHLHSEPPGQRRRARWKPHNDCSDSLLVMWFVTLSVHTDVIKGRAGSHEMQASDWRSQTRKYLSSESRKAGDHRRCVRGQGEHFWRSSIRVSMEIMHCLCRASSEILALQWYWFNF